MKTGRGDVMEIVFHQNGKYMEQNYIRRVFKRINSKVGIRKMRFHHIRNTYASLLLSQGESPVYVKEQLGHSSIQMTVDIFGHLIPGSNRGAVNRLDTEREYATKAHPAKKEKKPVTHWNYRLNLRGGAEGGIGKK